MTISSELRDQFTYIRTFFENLAQTSGLGLLRPHILNQAQMVIFTWKTQFSSYNVPVPDSLPPWRHCECSKYVFYIVEGYTMALKKSRVKNNFSSWRKLIFKKYILQKKIRKSKIEKIWFLNFEIFEIEKFWDRNFQLKSHLKSIFHFRSQN